MHYSLRTGGFKHIRVKFSNYSSLIEDGDAGIEMKRRVVERGENLLTTIPSNKALLGTPLDCVRQLKYAIGQIRTKSQDWKDRIGGQREFRRESAVHDPGLLDPNRL